MGNLMDMTLKDFCSLLSSSAPAPGGGSTAALSGTLGAALSMMVVNLSIGKKSYNVLSDEIKEEINKDFEALKLLEDELAMLVDEDTKAFKLYMDALKMSKEAGAEKEKCEIALHEASEYSLRVPLEVAGKCLEVLRHLQSIAEHGNKNAVSDAGVGALLAFAGLEGAALNVGINLPGIEDEKLKTYAQEKIACYQDEGRELRESIIKIVEKRII